MSNSRQRWPGRFTLDLGRALYVGPGLAADLHAHHAIQVGVALEGSMRIRASRQEAWRNCAGCMVAPEQPHEFDADGQPVALFYLEPEGVDGRRIATTVGAGGISLLDGGAVEKVRAAVACESIEGRDDRKTFDEAFEALGWHGQTRATDPRIREAVRTLRSCRGKYPGSAELAARAGLSTGRFRHLWLGEVGLSYRRYLLWLRLRAAIEALSEGSSATMAAHAAGFSDSAHLTRTFRRLLGIPPSAMPLLRPAAS